MVKNGADEDEATLKVNNPPDYETKVNYLCLGQVSESNGTPTSVTITFSVQITNVIDVAPTASASSYSCSINEEEPAGFTLPTACQPVFTDSEVSIGDTIGCSLEGPHATYFQINPTSCQISTASKFDTDNMPTSIPTSVLNSLFAVATDSAGLTGRAQVTVTVIDINDNSPICPLTVIIKEISELFTGTAIPSMGCTDKDTGPNGLLTYTPTTTSPKFSVDSSTGLFTVISAYDYDTPSPDQTIIVKVVDSSTNVADRKTTTVTVCLLIKPENDNPPVWSTWLPAYVSPPSTISTVSESAGVGFSIMHAKATDADYGADGLLTYFLLSAVGADTSNVLSAFDISSSTGYVTIKTPGLLDRESYSWVELTILAKDNGATSTTITRIARIAIADANEFAPVFTPSSGIYTVSIPESLASGSNVFKVPVIDPDAAPSPATIDCSISKGNTLGLFKISATDTTQIQLNTVIEPDKPTLNPIIYVLEIQCKDLGGGFGAKTSTASLTVSVALINDYSPTIVFPAGTNIVIPENYPAGDVSTINSGDLDVGADGTYTCTINPPGPFVIPSGCHKLLVTRLLDREVQSVYVLVVTAIDQGASPRSSSVTVTISLEDVNDNLPICNPSSYTVNLLETAAASPSIATVLCTDADTHGVQFAMTTASVPFAINATSGIVSYLGGADYDSPFQTYNLFVNCIDRNNSANVDICKVQVNIIAVNEFTPTFTDKTYSFSETVYGGQLVTTFAGSDADYAPDNIQTYRILSGNAAGYFSINTISADVYVATGKTMDYEIIATPTWSLIIEAVDGGTPKKTGSGTLSIVLQDANDNVPIFTQSVYTGNVNEGTGTVATVTTVVANDGDVTLAFKTMQYTKVSGDTANNFAVHATTGVVSKTSNALNYDTTPLVSFVVHAVDNNGAGPNTATTTVVVTVNDLNDNTPVCSPTTKTISNVREDVALGTSLYSFTAAPVPCSDADTAQTLTYSMSTVTFDNHFGIHPTTGDIRVILKLDYETNTNHIFHVIVKDNHSSPKSTTVTVTVSVLDVNEFLPVCTVPNAAAVADGAVSGTSVFSLVSCSDSDTSSTTFTFSISGTPFTASAAGVVTTTTVMDYESPTKSYVVVTKVVDNAPSIDSLKTATYSTTVDVTPVNEFKPVISPAMVYATIAENAAIGFTVTVSTAAVSGTVTSISATDGDLGSNHGTVTFSIVSGNSNGWFTLNPTTAVLTTTTTLDREITSSQILGVIATDGGGLVSTVTSYISVTITDINDNYPVFTTVHHTVSVVEGAGFPSTLVDFSLSSALADADIGANAALTLEFVSGVLPSPNNEFALSGRALVTSKSFSIAAGDSSQYVVVIRAKDGGLPSLSGSATVTVNIIRGNLATPSFATGVATVTLPENTAIGTEIYDVDAIDTDIGAAGTVTFSVGSISPSTTYFKLDTISGKVYVQNAMDYEAGTGIVFQMIVIATDAGIPPKSGSFTLTISITDVNDNDPQFLTTNEFSKTLTENVGANFPVTTVSWTDADSTTNAAVTCSIVSQSTPAIFTIDATTCAIKTTANPDREALDVYNIEVKLTDGGVPPRSKTKSFVVTLTDINDNAPSFTTATYTTSIAENLPAGTYVTTVVATDPDLGVNKDITYSMISGDGMSDVSKFSINSNTGEIKTTMDLDREAWCCFNIKVFAMDNGVPKLNSSATVLVNVTDVNDNTPVLVGTPYNGYVSEGALIGTSVYTIAGTDADLTWGVVSYHIISGNTLGLFRIDSSTGLIETALGTGLDRETTPHWNLTVAVRDNGSPLPLSSTATVVITVTDVNEFAPAWVNNSYHYTIVEGVAANTIIGYVPATDKDDGPLNNKINYAIDAVLVGFAGHFTIDSSTAEIKTSVVMDREATSSYQLRIRAWDSAMVPKTSTTCLTVTIYLTDINDNDPVIAQSLYSATVMENVAVGYQVLTIVASDPDSGNNAVLSYSISTATSGGVTANNYFSLDSTTGLLTVKSGLSRETIPSYGFNVVVKDGGTTPQRSSTTSVTITIGDSNESPQFSKSFYNAEVPQVDDGNMIIETVVATDSDIVGDNTVSYEWSELNQFFNLDSTSGVINRNTKEVIENSKIYTQVVVAKDKGTPPESTTTTVRIDTFSAEEFIVMIHFSMSETNYLNKLSSIKTNLASTLTGKYPDNRVGQWKYHIHGSNIVGYFYALQNKNTDSITNILLKKEFVPLDDLIAFWRFSSDGKPTEVLKSSLFSNTAIIKVEPYPRKSETSIPWYQTWWGILLLTLASLAGLAFLAATGYTMYACYQNTGGCKQPPAKSVRQPPMTKQVPQSRQILDLNRNKHPSHPRPKGKYLIQETTPQNKGVEDVHKNWSGTPRAQFENTSKGQELKDSNIDSGRGSPTSELGKIDF